MKILKYLQVAVESIVAHKLRAILTMLGIIIGVAAVLTTMGIGRGAASSMTERIASQGTNLLTLSPGASFSGGLAGEGGSAGTLTMGDVTALSDRTLHPALQLVAPAYGSSTRLVYEGNNTQSTVNGVTPEYATVRNMTLASGRFLSDEDNEQQNRVVVLGSSLTEDLFGTENPVGLSIRINGEPYEVVGVLEETGGFGQNPDTQAFVPLDVAQGRLFNATRYRGEYTVSTVYLQAVDGQTEAAKLEVEMTLRLRHGLSASDDNDFNISDQAAGTVSSFVNEAQTGGFGGGGIPGVGGGPPPQGGN
jgi:putative ABC transport system permease protein